MFNTAQAIGESALSYATMLSILTDCEDEESLNTILEQVEDNRERAEGKRFYQNWDKLYYLLQDGDGNVQCFDIVEGSFFHDCLMLLPVMVTDHKMASYQEAFDSL